MMKSQTDIFAGMLVARCTYQPRISRYRRLCSSNIFRATLLVAPFAMLEIQRVVSRPWTAIVNQKVRPCGNLKTSRGFFRNRAVAARRNLCHLRAATRVLEAMLGSRNFDNYP
jgi:hypothetical protein